MDLIFIYSNQTVVRLTKLAAHPGADNALLPTGYWVEGVFAKPPLPGHHILFFRARRPRWDQEDPKTTPEIVELPGIFESSEIMRIDGADIYTQNSVWRVSIVGESAS